VKAGLIASFPEGEGYCQELFGKCVVAEAEPDDGDPKKAAQIANRLVSDLSAILVVGHFNSTITKQVAPVYLDEAKPPLPELLVGETNPDILPPLPPRPWELRVLPVLRFIAPDDAEAELAATFASKHANRFFVIEDGKNPVYDVYLGDQFANDISLKHKEVLEVLPSLSLLSAEQLKTFGIDGVFFVGRWNNALILIHQLKDLGLGDKMPTVFLSASAAQQQLLNAGGNDLACSDAENCKVYLMNPQNAETFAESNQRVAKYVSSTISELIMNANIDHLGDEKSKGWLYRLSHLFGIGVAAEPREALAEEVAGDSNCTVKELPAPCGEFADYYQIKAEEYVWYVAAVEKRNSDPVYEFKNAGDGVQTSDLEQEEQQEEQR